MAATTCAAWARRSKASALTVHVRIVLDKAWNTGIADDEWIARLADRRTGFRDPAARTGWRTLCDSVYTLPAQTGQSPLTNAHPALEGNWHWTTKPTTGYRFPTLWRVWEELLAVDSERDTYRFDVVNIGRQVLGDYFLIERDRFAAAYAQHDRKAMDAAARRMTGLLADINLLTACHPEFSLERWIAAARGFGSDNASKDYYETTPPCSSRFGATVTTLPITPAAHGPE